MSSALIICDCQPDLLRSVPEDRRRIFLSKLKLLVEKFQDKKPSCWNKNIVVFTGVRFGQNYSGVNHEHKIYGGFARLNAKLGDDKIGWFLDGKKGADIEEELLKTAEGGDIFQIFRHRFSKISVSKSEFLMPTYQTTTITLSILNIIVAS